MVAVVLTRHANVGRRVRGSTAGAALAAPAVPPPGASAPPPWTGRSSSVIRVLRSGSYRARVLSVASPTDATDGLERNRHSFLISTFPQKCLHAFRAVEPHRLCP